ncbi:MICOS complex subunit MIC19 [Entomortierella parvispora]|uniref:MICOS complex subunit MIC19 n=1 Tax=Entomortierella parvispora TaxID=205924 RepID=A0A9P3H5Q2_9FUNG|nr:MICOS complex subunit MIC19 [Entomortierella parvispora]
MGSQPSKDKPMVFVNDETVPVRVSSSFVNQISQSQPVTGSPEDIESQVRQRVHAELTKIQAEKEATLPYTNYHSSTHGNALVTEQDMDQLARSAPAKQVKILPEDITKAQYALVQCYRDNKDRSLDCWKEVQEFKDLVQKAQNAFIATV